VTVEHLLLRELQSLPELASSEAIAALRPLLAELPAIWAGFECRLHADRAAIDVGFGALRSRAAGNLIASWIRRVALPGATGSAAELWQRVLSFTEGWARGDAPDVYMFGFEVDMAAADLRTTLPAVFFYIDDKATQPVAIATVIELCERVWGHAMPGPLRQNVEAVMRAVEGRGTLKGAGTLLSRDLQAVKLVFDGLDADAVDASLTDLALGASRDALEAALAGGLRASASGLSLDLAGRLSPRVATFLVPGAGRSTRELLAMIGRADGCSAAKCEALARWERTEPIATGALPTHLRTTAALLGDRVRGFLHREVTHLKVAAAPQRPPELKAYASIDHRLHPAYQDS
jgi:hypothetical protein